MVILIKETGREISIWQVDTIFTLLRIAQSHQPFETNFFNKSGSGLIVICSAILMQLLVCAASSIWTSSCRVGTASQQCFFAPTSISFLLPYKVFLYSLLIYKILHVGKEQRDISSEYSKHIKKYFTNLEQKPQLRLITQQHWCDLSLSGRIYTFIKMCSSYYTFNIVLV